MSLEISTFRLSGTMTGTCRRGFGGETAASSGRAIAAALVVAELGLGLCTGNCSAGAELGGVGGGRTGAASGFGSKLAVCPLTWGDNCGGAGLDATSSAWSGTLALPAGAVKG